MKSHTLLVCFSADGSVELDGRKEVTEEYTIMYGSEDFILFTFECTSVFLKMKMVVASWDVCLGHTAYSPTT